MSCLRIAHACWHPIPSPPPQPVPEHASLCSHFRTLLPCPAPPASHALGQRIRLKKQAKRRQRAQAGLGQQKGQTHMGRGRGTPASAALRTLRSTTPGCQTSASVMHHRQAAPAGQGCAGSPLGCWCGRGGCPAAAVALPPARWSPCPGIPLARVVLPSGDHMRQAMYSRQSAGGHGREDTPAAWAASATAAATCGARGGGVCGAVEVSSPRAI